MLDGDKCQPVRPIYTFPADCKLVSGVFTVRCSVELSNPITLEMQHCGIQREGLKFVQADCTQKQLPYSFNELEGGKFTDRSAHIKIKLSQPSLIGVVLSWKHEPPKMASVHPSANRYWAQFYLTSVGKQSWEVYFVIMRDVPISIKVSMQS